MTLAEETCKLRHQLNEWANDPEWSLLVRYELLPLKPSPVWDQRLSHRMGRLLRVLGLSRARYLNQQWHAGLKHGYGAPAATPLLIWSEEHDRPFMHKACEGMLRLLDGRSDFSPVLVSDLADFSFFSRLGWLVEYLPEITGAGSSYRDRKRRYLAWRYRDAIVVPLSAGLASRQDWEMLLKVDCR